MFVLCSTFAAVGGVLAAGPAGGRQPGSGGGDVNLNAIAAAVIGGTSLFGGRGSAFSALLGILVIQSISSGLTLLNLDSSFRFMVTGAGAAAGRRRRLRLAQVADLVTAGPEVPIGRQRARPWRHVLGVDMGTGRSKGC